MSVVSDSVQLSSKGRCDIIDITPDVQAKLQKTGIKNGVVSMNVCGSTSALTTCEYESGLIQDIKDIFDKLIPAGRYNHNKTWGDGNGHSHLRASLVGPSLTLPFEKGKLVLGTWQQIIFIDFDNRPRQRKIFLQFLGE